VSLFKRRGSADDDSTDGTDEAVLDDDPTTGDAADTDDGGRVRGERTTAQQAAAELRALGPRDVSEVEDTSALLDLGAILVAPSDGMELRLELNEEDGEHVVGVTALIGDSAVQVQAFAAPRSEGIWDEVREEIAAGITQQGGTADIVDGAFGTELLARVPAPDANGRSAFQPARFVGIDGPRWFLRGVISGQGAVQPEAAGMLEQIFRDTVVVRGDSPMAPRDPIVLKLPNDAQMVPESVAQDGDQPRFADGIDPLRRGPEITEVH